MVVVFALSIKYGYGGLLKRDVLVLVASAFILLVWYFTQQPVLAVYLTTLVDALGGGLTIVKAYEAPDTETPITWAMSGLAGFFALLSVGHINVPLLVYPAYIFLINSSVVVAILLGRRAVRLRGGEYLKSL